MSDGAAGADVAAAAAAAAAEGQPKIHPDLAAIFAAGDAVLPDIDAPGSVDSGGAAGAVGTNGSGDDDGATAPPQARAAPKPGSEWTLGVLLKEALTHAADKAKQAASAPAPPPRAGAAGGGDATVTDNNGGTTATSSPEGSLAAAPSSAGPARRTTVSLGDGISWGAGTAHDPSSAPNAEDASLMMLSEADFPGTRRRNLFFKLGSALPRLGDPDAEFTCDRHRPFCGPLLELSTELTNFWGAAGAVEGEGLASAGGATECSGGERSGGGGGGGAESGTSNHSTGFPMFVKDIRYVFETADGAALYLRRSWRYLTENWVPDLPPDADAARLPPTELLYGRYFKERVPLADGVGDDAMCFLSPPSASQALRGHEGVAVGRSAIVVFRVGSVVAKVYVASRDGKLPADVVHRAVAATARRIEAWCGAKSTPGVLRSLPPDLRDFWQEFLSEWRACVERVLTWPRPRKSVEFGAAPCQVCQSPGAHRRCSGCRGFTYCSAECQRKHWAAGHKIDCTGEFITALSADCEKRRQRKGGGGSGKSGKSDSRGTNGK